MREGVEALAVAPPQLGDGADVRDARLLAGQVGQIGVALDRLKRLLGLGAQGLRALGEAEEVFGAQKEAPVGALAPGDTPQPLKRRGFLGQPAF